jgi:hypothetical protein
MFFFGAEMFLDLLQADTILSNFSSFFSPVELKVPNVIGTEMAFTECMRYHSFFRDPALSSKHIMILEKDITTLATTFTYASEACINTIYYQIYKP